VLRNDIVKLTTQSIEYDKTVAKLDFEYHGALKEKRRTDGRNISSAASPLLWQFSKHNQKICKEFS